MTFATTNANGLSPDATETLHPSGYTITVELSRGLVEILDREVDMLEWEIQTWLREPVFGACVAALTDPLLPDSSIPSATFGPLFLKPRLSVIGNLLNAGNAERLRAQRCP